MKIFDSNLIIYSSLDKYGQLRPLITARDVFVSAITKIETLGYYQLDAEDKAYFDAFFEATTIIPITDSVIDKATEIRQMKKMSVGDCIIAATALLHNLELHTNNTKDFTHITGLTVMNPLHEQ